MRFQRFLNQLQENRLDGFLISRLSNLHYLFGFRGSAGLALCLGGRAHLLVDSRYLQQARQTAHDCTPCLAEGSYESALRGLMEKLQEDGAAPRIGVEENHLTWAWVRQIESWELNYQIAPAQDLVGVLRRCKEADEIALIREALRLAQTALGQVRPRLRPGMSEIEMAGELERALRRQGAEGYAFESIVAGGERSALPHASASDRLWRADELLLVDFGLRRRGYHSDLTRVILPPGGEEEKRVAEIVRQAAGKAVAAIKPGVEARAVDQAARQHIAEAGYGDYFGHGLGHGLGLDVHEAPRVSKTGTEVLAEGMVFTVEPGIYLPGRFGVRIEDVVAVTRDGFEYLSDPSL
ncbi:MAG TPA: Xaa-Pro peptidase family protein [Acidobacteriota bacterium]|nr:Xaa-Pro peptidase family protein [Acidobacteriota bacterium]